MKKHVYVPELVPSLRSNYIKLPEIIGECSGIKIMGKRIQSLLFTTDVAIIKFASADAIIAVYPFTPQPAITQAVLSVAHVPVFCGVGGGLTPINRSMNAALNAEFQGAMAVVLNANTSLELIEAVKKTVDIPVVITIVSEYTCVQEKIQAGADIINVSGGIETPKIVKKIRAFSHTLPIIATGGPNEQTILSVIEAGANAVSYTAPSNADLFKIRMEQYRREENEKYMKPKPIENC